VIDPESGYAFREHILSKGNSEPVDELFRRFMGRDASLDALLKRSGLHGDDMLLAGDSVAKETAMA
jgi:Zn-dependent oligopeptidase